MTTSMIVNIITIITVILASGIAWGKIVASVRTIEEWQSRSDAESRLALARTREFEIAAAKIAEIVRYMDQRQDRIEVALRLVELKMPLVDLMSNRLKLRSENEQR